MPEPIVWVDPAGTPESGPVYHPAGTGGYATSAKQAEEIALLTAIRDKPTTGGGGEGGSTDITTLAKEAKQDTQNAQLATISGQLALDATAVNQVAQTVLLEAITSSAANVLSATSTNGGKLDTLDSRFVDGNVLLSALNIRIQALLDDLTLRPTVGNQSTGNASLASIDTKVGGLATAAGQATNSATFTSIDGKLTDAASRAKQDAMIGSLASIDTKTSAQATAALQTTGNTSLAALAALIVSARLNVSATFPSAQAVTVTSGAITATPSTAVSTPVVGTASTNAGVVKASGGNLYVVSITNPTAATVFVKLYNKATAPTVGTDAPVLTIPVAAGQRLTEAYPPVGHRLGTGISYAITANAATTDATAVAAGVQLYITNS